MTYILKRKEYNLYCKLDLVWRLASWVASLSEPKLSLISELVIR
jgi:hypothetical protein